MGQIVTNKVDFSAITSGSYPPVNCFIIGLDTADDKLKKLDHNGVLTEIGGSSISYTAENVINKSIDGTFSSDSDVLYPSEKAVKTYVDTITSSKSSPYWIKTTKTYQDFSINDTGNTIELVTLPAKTIFHDIYYLQTIPFDQATPGINMTNSYLGQGTATVYTFPFTLGAVSNIGGVVITDTVETFADNGDGTFTSNLGGTGTIDYGTGVGSVTFNTAPATGQAVTATWNSFSSGGGMLFDFGTGAKTVFSLNSVDILAYLTPPLVAGTLAVGPVNFSFPGDEMFTDNGDGTMTGSGGGTGIVNYTTGAFSVTFAVAPINGRGIRINSYSSTPNNSSQIGTGSVAVTHFEGGLSTPIAHGSATITNTTETFADDSNGNMIGSNGGTGTIDYDNGYISINYVTPPDDGQYVILDYGILTTFSDCYLYAYCDYAQLITGNSIYDPINAGSFAGSWGYYGLLGQSFLMDYLNDTIIYAEVQANVLLDSLTAGSVDIYILVSDLPN
jgi:hypothetical protein